MPNIFKSVKDAKSGGAFLNNLGVDKSFIGQQYQKYAPYLSKIPGMNSTVADPLINAITGEMDNNSMPQINETKPLKSFKKLDKNKYPKL